MPQANITYDTPYNRALASRVLAKEARQARGEESTVIPMRLGSFHDPHSAPMVGGGAPQEYITNGNSPAYPPLHMRSGMEVSSGGAYAGVDGAVGGGFWKDFARGFTGVLDVATAPLTLLAPPLGVGIGATSQAVKGLAGSGRSGGAHSGGAMSGAGFWSDFGRGFKKGFFGTAKALTKPIELLAPELKPVTDITNALGQLAGEGEGGAFGDSLRGVVGRAKKLSKHVAPVAEMIFGKKSPFLKQAVGFAHELGRMLPADMRGGLGLKDLSHAVNSVEGIAKQVAPLLPFAMKYLRGSGASKCSECMYHDAMMRLGKTMRGSGFWTDMLRAVPAVISAVSGGAQSGGFSLGDVGKYIKKGKKAVDVGKKGLAAVQDAVELVKGLKGGAQSGGFHMVGNKKDKCGRSSGTRYYGTPCEGGAASGGAASGGAASGGAMSGGKKNGRAARAAIVKKVMAERGVKMIEASKIVKAEGLY
jgi:hypothetical protein